MVCDKGLSKVMRTVLLIFAGTAIPITIWAIAHDKSPLIGPIVGASADLLYLFVHYDGNPFKMISGTAIGSAESTLCGLINLFD